MSQGDTEGKKANRLIHETSPYLIQHAYNPVDWQPWGNEALERAKKEEKPILLSIGYSACHWCHVMERESFEDDQVAAVMNDNFVNIKVDREERPDLDAIYQTAGQLLTGQGGWPLTVFLTPDQRPFYAGTYFPPDDRFGRPGFVRVMQSLIRTYKEEPDRIERAAEQVTEALRQVDTRSVEGKAEIAPEEGEALLAKAVDWLGSHFDTEHGGFGSQPKFPNSPALELFIRHAVRSKDAGYLDLVTLALTKMAEGGLYDHLGGGFHRYSTDAAWMVPHFEKMLYDNALLPLVYLQGYQLTGDELYKHVVRETLEYVEREMSHPEGGFFSTQDADSEGEEGKFFVWRPEQIHDVLGTEDASLICDHFGVTPAGNFEHGATVLHIAKPVEALAEGRGTTVEAVRKRLNDGKTKLFRARESRVKPGRDEKVITGWTALMVSTFAKAASVFQVEAYRQRAEEAVGFVESHLVRGDRLLRSFKDKPSRSTGYLEDYAFWVQGLLDLYEASLDRKYRVKAEEWMARTLELFWDDESPGFFLTPKDHEALIHRPKDWRDQSIPSGTGVSVLNLLRLHPAADGQGYDEKARAVLESYRKQLDQNPWGTASLLLAYDAAVFGPIDVVLVADESRREAVQPFAAAVGRRYVPHLVMHLITPKEAESDATPLLWRGKAPREGRVTAYACRGFSCSPPVTDPDELAELLSEDGQLAIKPDLRA